MPAKERKPMTFSMNPTPAHQGTTTGKVANDPKSVSPVEGASVERQQVGARVTKATYRQLKARAALTGATVQELVEQAINDLLAKPL